MSKYTELVVANSKEENIEVVAAENGQILQAEIIASIKMHEAVVLKSQIEFSKAEKAVVKAQGNLTNDSEEYITNIFALQAEQDELAEELQDAEAMVDKLKELVKIFN